MTPHKVYRCWGCGVKYNRKVWFDRHFCTRGEKLHEVHTEQQQKAYTLYQTFLALTGDERFDRGAQAFRNNSLHGNFVKLVVFLKRQKILDHDAYLGYCLGHKLGVRQWCDPKTVYAFNRHAILSTASSTMSISPTVEPRGISSCGIPVPLPENLSKTSSGKPPKLRLAKSRSSSWSGYRTSPSR